MLGNIKIIEIFKQFNKFVLKDFRKLLFYYKSRKYFIISIKSRIY